MGIFYGDIHYGVKISKITVIDDDIFIEQIEEVLFDDKTISLTDYLNKVAPYIYLNLLEPVNYRFELFVDVITTYDGIKSNKGWQIITTEQMINFIDGTYKMEYLEK